MLKPIGFNIRYRVNQQKQGKFKEFMDFFTWIKKRTAFLLCSVNALKNDKKTAKNPVARTESPSNDQSVRTIPSFGIAGLFQ